MMQSDASQIVLGGGCFWCLEAAYQQLEGVVEVVPGYSGGAADQAVDDAVSTGRTDHAEVVRVTYDPKRLDLETIMAVFWLIHDPTSLNRQGADSGPQYASVVYYEDDSQKETVISSRDEAQRQLDSPIVTRVEPLTAFYEAEAYHHNYFLAHPEAGYCRAVIEPKLQKLRQHFSGQLTS